jgi:phosphatidylglycerol---prolipoprotein diacylglyceryl transferase
MLTLAVYLHDINPIIFELPGGLAVRWYGMSYLLGFLIAYGLILAIVKRGVSTLKPKEVGDLIVCLALGIVIGGRLGYVFFYKPSLLWQLDSHLPFWGVLKINQGGMASHGGMIGGIVASLYYGWKHRHPKAHVLDLFAFGAPLGLFFGRCANFINGELYGRPMQKVMPWAVKFPGEMERWFPRNEALWDPKHLAAVNAAEAQLPPHEPFDSLAQQVDALIAAMYDGNQRVIRVLEPVLAPRHPSQLYEALLEGLLLGLVLLVLWYRPRKPFVVCGTFGLVYGLVRILGEQFREPDLHIGYDWLGLTRGQWLSIGLVITGVVLIVIGLRRDAPKMGGWGGVRMTNDETRMTNQIRSTKFE